MSYGYNTPNRISPRKAWAVMQSNPKAVFVDVRTSQEYGTGRIPGAMLLPDRNIKTQAPRLLPDKDALIIVYCQRGGRSHTSACELMSMGYTNVCNLGGIESWPYAIERE